MMLGYAAQVVAHGFAINSQAAAGEEDDYQLALRLQREFDEQERLAMGGGGYEVRDDQEEMEDEDSGHAQREDEEAFEQQQVTAAEAGSDATALDADFAMALALQAEFAEKDTRGPAPSPYRKEPNEKGTHHPLAHSPFY
jgi:hypothetical protein